MAKKELTFEEAMNRLSTVVSTLEQNDQPLDTTIDLFEEGLNLVKPADKAIQAPSCAKNKIQIINGIFTNI